MCEGCFHNDLYVNVCKCVCARAWVHVCVCTTRAYDACVMHVVCVRTCLRRMCDVCGVCTCMLTARCACVHMHVAIGLCYIAVGLRRVSIWLAGWLACGTGVDQEGGRRLDDT